MDSNFLMETDSGYVSHLPESTFEVSNQSAIQSKGNYFFNSSEIPQFCWSEDTLLERPIRIPKDCSSYSEVVATSQETPQTDFSGFADDPDASILIPCASNITYRRSLNRSSCTITSSSDISMESPYNDSRIMETSKLSMSGTKKTTFFVGPNKENIHPLSNLSSFTPEKSYENSFTSDISPDLFLETSSCSKTDRSPKKSPKKLPKLDREVKILRRIRDSLKGVCPPPQRTVCQLTVNEMLGKLEENKNLFVTTTENPCLKLRFMKLEKEEFFINSVNNIRNCRWPEILKVSQHGLHFNKSHISEEVERLCMKFGERHVGAETQSTCTVFETNLASPTSRKSVKSKWSSNNKSPGRRLSHLARRRITFSSSNLQNSSSSSILGSRARQILVDAKRSSLGSKKSPPKKSPFKSTKKTKSPTSSTKKKRGLQFREFSNENNPLLTNSGIKRVLFQSPSKPAPSVKRTLFKTSPERKRKRLSNESLSSEDDFHPPKMPRSISHDLEPLRKRVNLNRTVSDSTLTSKGEELSNLHKKKLQLAVYEALCQQGVSHTHPNFKNFASNLARVTRKFLPLMKQEARTTEKMRRVARYHSYAVVKGKSVDEIVNDYLASRNKNQKPRGYVSIPGGDVKSKSTGNVHSAFGLGNKRDNVLQDNRELVNKSTEKNNEKPRFFSSTRLERIKKVILFDDKS